MPGNCQGKQGSTPPFLALSWYSVGVLLLSLAIPWQFLAGRWSSSPQSSRAARKCQGIARECQGKQGSIPPFLNFLGILWVFSCFHWQFLGNSLLAVSLVCSNPREQQGIARESKGVPHPSWHVHGILWVFSCCPWQFLGNSLLAA
jgi:hypothetical protein